MTKFTVIPKKAIWQFGKIGVLVNFIPQKLKSKPLVYLSFEGKRENILHIFRALNEP